MSNTNRHLNNGQTEEFIRANKKEKEDKSGPFYSLNPDLKALLNLTRLPGSLNAALTAGLLGFKPHEIPVLVARGFLKPLGNPSPNGEKFFARVTIEKRAADEEWLSRARAAVNQHWRMKNARKSDSALRV